MNIDDFMQEFAGTAARLAAEAKARDAYTASNQMLYADNLDLVRDLLQRYRDRLATFNIDAYAEESENAISLSLYWSDNDGVSFRLRRDNDGRVVIEDNFLPYKAANVVVTEIVSLDRASFALSKVEEELQSFIETFADAASEHDGI